MEHFEHAWRHTDRSGILCERVCVHCSRHRDRDEYLSPGIYSRNTDILYVCVCLRNNTSGETLLNTHIFPTPIPVCLAGEDLRKMESYLRNI